MMMADFQSSATAVTKMARLRLHVKLKNETMDGHVNRSIDSGKGKGV
jgi:hypothetical protein